MSEKLGNRAELFASFPIHKPSRQQNLKFKGKLNKIFKNFPGKILKPSVEEHNQFFLVNLLVDPATSSNANTRELVETAIKTARTELSDKLLKHLKKLIKKDSELKSSIAGFQIADKLEYLDLTEGLTLLKSLPSMVIKEITKIFVDGSIVIWNNPANKYCSLILGKEKIEYSQDKVTDLGELSDELTLAGFGKQHFPVLSKATEEIQRLIAGFLQKMDSLVTEISSITSIAEKEGIIEISSILLGKILGVREPINLAKKQIKRYLELEADLQDVSPDISKIGLDLFKRAFDKESLTSTLEKLEVLEKTISSNYIHLKNTLERLEELNPGSESSENGIIEFVKNSIKIYHNLERFRFITESFEDIPSFTTVKGAVSDKITADRVNKGMLDKYVIYADGLFKTFQLINSTVYALRGISLKVKYGEFVAIMGASGSGKTTLLNILSGLDSFGDGVLYLDKIDMRLRNEGQLVKMRKDLFSFVYQSYNLLPVLLSVENVQLPADFGTKNKIGNKSERSTKLLKEVGLEQFTKTRPLLLSGGQRQRVTIARAMMNNPKILFCDEPTGDLDRATGDQVMDLLMGINKDGVTIVLVTHDLAVAQKADRIIRMLDGKIISEEVPNGK